MKEFTEEWKRQWTGLNTALLNPHAARLLADAAIGNKARTTIRTLSHVTCVSTSWVDDVKLQMKDVRVEKNQYMNWDMKHIYIRNEPVRLSCKTIVIRTAKTRKRNRREYEHLFKVQRKKIKEGDIYALKVSNHKYK
jgi:hypothetical protein